MPQEELMDMKTLLIFATQREAAPTLKKQFKNCTSIITGMGPLPTFKAISQQIQHYDRIVNAGICGTFDEKTAVGSIHTVSRLEYLPLKQHQGSLFPSLRIHPEGQTLYTSPVPVYESKRETGLVDMEGYVLAHLALKHKKPIQMYKIVSDFCSKDSKEHILKRIDALALTLSDYLETVL